MLNSYRNLPEFAGSLWIKSSQILHFKPMINREKCLQKCLFLLCNALVDFSKDKREFLCIVGFKFKEPC